jgi:hypothetical protein
MQSLSRSVAGMRRLVSRLPKLVRVAVVGMLTMFALTTLAGTAAANGIQTTYYSDNDTSIVRDWCDFPVRITGIGDYKQVDYLDSEGRIIKSTFTADAGPYRWIISANGVSLETNSAYKAWLFYDERGDVVEYRESGEVFAFTAPGMGVVFVLTGHFVQETQTGEVTFEAGPRDEDFSDLCAALS